MYFVILRRLKEDNLWNHIRGLVSGLWRENDKILKAGSVALDKSIYL